MALKKLEFTSESGNVDTYAFTPWPGSFNRISIASPALRSSLHDYVGETGVHWDTGSIETPPLVDNPQHTERTIYRGDWGPLGHGVHWDTPFSRQSPTYIHLVYFIIRHLIIYLTACSIILTWILITSFTFLNNFNDSMSSALYVKCFELHMDLALYKIKISLLLLLYRTNGLPFSGSLGTPFL